MDPASSSRTSSPRSHTDRLAVWAVDVSGWALSLENNSDFDSLPDTALEPSSSSSSSSSSSHKGKGTRVDRIIEDLFGDNGVDPISDDMRRASTKIRKYFREVDRVRSLAGQLLPRVMYMSEYGSQQCSWANIKFDATPEKRPFLAEPQLPCKTDYNVTHDEDWVALAYHRPCLPHDPPSSSRSTSIHDPNPEPLRVGIDVMAVALPQFDPSVAGFVNMMELAMTPSEKHWVYAANPSARSAEDNDDNYDFFALKKAGSTRNPPQQPEELKPEDLEMLMRLYDLWTYKEAFTKNVGRGLGFDFSTIEVALWRCARVTLPKYALAPSPNGALGPGKEAADVLEDFSDRVVRAAKEHGSRISAGPFSSKGSASATATFEPILTIAGKPEGRYSFTEIHLPSSRKGTRQSLTSASHASSSSPPRRARSQLVVCEGPFPEGTFAADMVQVAPALDYEDAIKAGLLKVWTMEELVAEARRLRKASPPAS
ncbi:hypothetical protein OC846_003384 [Tilletia horrida]|uniref:holo-[acyl-carrier-protein] synthase n=1 Tax=Tilletia horrida TaxID=155126 RepID=A0AAN6GPS9_9BASI|nr:hypothetical protein OC845_003209 [Tilletia horrida]KAK0551144.1 hypothetical protein OC846_003384 [Tilletia horrida]KAK0566123.1 hypothetical protein OC861_003417 [Tilletia horrida]